MKRKIALLVVFSFVGVFSAHCSEEAAGPEPVSAGTHTPDEWVEMLTDENQCTRTAALLALESMGEDAVPELLRALDCADDSSRH